MAEKAAEKKVKYIASMIYLALFTFIVLGTYINQQIKADAEVTAVESAR